MTNPSEAAKQEALEAIAAATQRLVRTVDGLDDRALAAPSLLPGWTRAHVVAHLALNAEGMAGALEGVVRGDSVPMYASNEARNADIEELAAAAPDRLRERLLASGTALAEALRRAPREGGPTFPRVPAGPAVAVDAVPTMRRREVEIHHADLDAGYRPGDWPRDFAVVLVEQLVADRGSSADVVPFVVRASDLDRTWTVGETGPGETGAVVTGTASALGWWLCGRGGGEGLTVERGSLPELGRWR